MSDNPTLSEIVSEQIAASKQRARESTVKLAFSRSPQERRAAYYSQLEAVNARCSAECARLEALKQDVIKAKEADATALNLQLAEMNEQLRAEYAAAVDAALPAPLAKWNETGLRADAAAFGEVVRALGERQRGELESTAGHSELVKGLCRAFQLDASEFSGVATEIISSATRYPNQPAFIERALRVAEEIVTAKYFGRRK